MLNSHDRKVVDAGQKNIEGPKGRWLTVALVDPIASSYSPCWQGGFIVTKSIIGPAGLGLFIGLPTTYRSWLLTTSPSGLSLI